MGHEAAAGAKAIRTNLLADTDLSTLVSTGIYAESAPQDAALPYVVLRQRSPGDDSQVLNPRRVMSSPLVDVGVWVEDDPFSSSAQIGSKRIDVVLSALASYPVTDENSDTWEVSSRREGGAWVREEVDPKTMKKYYWVGGSYRLSISAV